MTGRMLRRTSKKKSQKEKTDQKPSNDTLSGTRTRCSEWPGWKRAEEKEEEAEGTTKGKSDLLLHPPLLLFLLLLLACLKADLNLLPCASRAVA